MTLETLITKNSLATQLNVSERTLDRWHLKRIGPARTKTGNFVAYRKEAIEEWIKSNEVRPTDKEGVTCH